MMNRRIVRENLTFRQVQISFPAKHFGFDNFQNFFHHNYQLDIAAVYVCYNHSKIIDIVHITRPSSPIALPCPGHVVWWRILREGFHTNIPCTLCHFPPTPRGVLCKRSDTRPSERDVEVVGGVERGRCQLFTHDVTPACTLLALVGSNSNYNNEDVIIVIRWLYL